MHSIRVYESQILSNWQSAFLPSLLLSIVFFVSTPKRPPSNTISALFESQIPLNCKASNPANIFLCKQFWFVRMGSIPQTEMITVGNTIKNEFTSGHMPPSPMRQILLICQTRYIGTREVKYRRNSPCSFMQPYQTRLHFTEVKRTHTKKKTGIFFFQKT